MTNPRLSIFAASCLAAIILPQVPCHAQGDEPKTPLSQEMSGISRDLRSLRKAMSDPSQTNTAVSLVKDMEAHATKAKTFDPAKTRQIPAADKDQFLADYHKQMDGLIADFQKLEQDISSGNTADANAMLTKLQGDKREGHKKFNAQDDHGPGGGRQWGGGPGGPGGGPGGPGGGPGPGGPDNGPGPGGPPPGAPAQSGTNGQN